MKIPDNQTDDKGEKSVEFYKGGVEEESYAGKD